MENSTRFRQMLLALGLLLPMAPTARPLAQLRVSSQMQFSSPLEWRPVQMELPPSIQVFAAAGNLDAQPRAWYVDVDYNDQNLRAQPWLSKSANGRETGLVFTFGLHPA